MVDITAKIIWYRLGEAYENAIEASHEFSEWYEQFSWRKVDILDMLFLGWLLVAFIVVGIINLYLRFFGLPRSKQSLGTSSSSSSSPGSLKGRDVGEGESVDWINAALSWFFLHYNHTPEFVDSWMRALNEQARKHATDYQIRFERVQAGSLPPTFHDVTAQVAEKQYLSLKSRVEAKDMTLLVAVIQQSATNIKMSNYDVTVTNLKGRVKIHSTYANNELQANVSFDQSPELQLKITPRDYQSKVDTEMLDRVVRQSLAGAVTVVSLPTQGGYPSFYLPTDNIQSTKKSTTTKETKTLSKNTSETDSQPHYNTGLLRDHACHQIQDQYTHRPVEPPIDPSTRRPIVVDVPREQILSSTSREQIKTTTPREHTISHTSTFSPTLRDYYPSTKLAREYKNELLNDPLETVIPVVTAKSLRSSNVDDDRIKDFFEESQLPAVTAPLAAPEAYRESTRPPSYQAPSPVEPTTKPPQKAPRVNVSPDTNPQASTSGTPRLTTYRPVTSRKSTDRSPTARSPVVEPGVLKEPVILQSAPVSSKASTNNHTIPQASTNKSPPQASIRPSINIPIKTSQTTKTKPSISVRTEAQPSTSTSTNISTSAMNNGHASSPKPTSRASLSSSPVSPKGGADISPSASVSPYQERSPWPRNHYTSPPKVYVPSKAGGGISTITKDKKLLVKVIKANGLGDKDFGCCDPYCIITTDIPDQTNTTSVVKNTINPFWDEHFIFDVEDNTKQLKFEVYNQEKRDALLGKADIHVSELRRMPSSRQIIPLTGRPGSATTTSGSITVEFLFMDAVESQNLIANHDAVSPRRQVETNRKLTPGGTLVTTTTTTTQKPKDHRMDATGYNETPSMIEKMESDLNQEYPGYSPTTPTAHLGAHEAGLNASQAPASSLRSTNSPRLMVTEMESQFNKSDTMTESSPAEQDVTSHSSSMDAHEVKKSKSFASTLKRKFQRNPKKNRSQSADRATMRDSSLLRPPDNREHRASEDGDPTDVPTGGTLRKSRSHSFSSSLKRLFRKKKKDGDISRDNSMSRGSTRSHQEAGSHSPQLSSYSRNSSLRQPSPDVAARDFSYSSSVPAAPSPLYDQYKVQ